MTSGPRQRGGAWRSAAFGVVAALAAAIAPPLDATAAARDDESEVIAWIDRHAVPLTLPDFTSPSTGLDSLRSVVRPATVVGLGEPTHGSHEQFAMKLRIVQFLVEHAGFRTVAFENDFATGLAIDRYVTTGVGDPVALVSEMSSPFWATEEIVDLVRWLRSYNQTHTEPVRFFGADLLQLRQESFDAITAFVSRVAPERLDELTVELDRLRLRGSPPEHLRWYLSLDPTDRQPLIAAAQRVSELVDRLHDRTDPTEREYARQHARAMVGWHRNYDDESLLSPVRERFIANSIRWWQRLTSDTIVYWAANAHTAAASSITYRTPFGEDAEMMAGGRLERHLGRQYVSIGLVFGHGAITSDFRAPGPHPIGPPRPDLLDATLDAAAEPTFLIALAHRRVPRPVRRWLSAASSTRMILPSYTAAEDGSAYAMTVPELGDAFDVVVFITQTTPSRLIAT